MQAEYKFKHNCRTSSLLPQLHLVCFFALPVRAHLVRVCCIQDACLWDTSLEVPWDLTCMRACPTRALDCPRQMSLLTHLEADRRWYWLIHEGSSRQHDRLSS